MTSLVLLALHQQLLIIAVLVAVVAVVAITLREYNDNLLSTEGNSRFKRILGWQLLLVVSGWNLFGNSCLLSLTPLAVVVGWCHINIRSGRTWRIGRSNPRRATYSGSATYNLGVYIHHTAGHYGMHLRRIVDVQNLVVMSVQHPFKYTQ